MQICKTEDKTRECVMAEKIDLIIENVKFFFAKRKQATITTGRN